MLALERHRRLLNLLNRQGSVRTAEIARALKVTEETVRRDFEKLEAEGTLLRSHGGAVKLDSLRREFPAEERAKQNAPAKHRIAQAALAHVQPGKTLYLDASTTVLGLAKLLPDVPVTVLTNSLQIALTLTENPSIHTVLVGGSILASSLSCTGWAAEQTLDSYRVDLAFVSCRGIEARRGLSEASEEQARLKRKVLAQAEEVLLLADSSKVNTASTFFYAKLSDLDLWITEKAVAQPLKSALASAGVRIEVAG